MKIYKLGKDQEFLPCVDFEDGSVHTDIEVLEALIKAIIKKGTITLKNIKDEL